MCNAKVVDATLANLQQMTFCLQANIITVDPNFSGPFVDIAKQHDPPASAAIDSMKELAVIEQDGETNELIEKDVSMKLDKIKLDEEIRELEKTIEKKRTLRRMWEECF
ncbi:hypothetical protein LOK49_LG14G01867 [Camellia lanceoleosa]|uniref:Uncharacterized protein n=1 Tax=Camellia lanceoleosa TaxID=1840588 RepID=A0ACC0F9T1_9ERIC|nr:hypothetical protein LOK49_LG14G01867 [Camellia lanceoleosa]